VEKRATPALTGGNHVLFLDYLRGLAIFLVFIFHCYQMTFGVGGQGNPTASQWMQMSPWMWPLLPVSLGWVGVPIFFVISGFCIHLSHARSREKGFKTFFLRRFFRIYPPYLVALLFFALIFPFTRLGFKSLDDLVNFTTHLLLVHNFNLGSLYGINGAFWSIAVEVQLYLLYPLLLWLVRGGGWNKGLFVVFTIELISIYLPALRFHFAPSASWLWDSLSRGPFTYWFSWSIGARIADDWLANRPIFTSRLPIWLGAICFLISSLVPGLQKFAFLCGAILTAQVVARLLSSPAMAVRLLAFPSSGHFCKAGLVSYSLYLLHEPFIVLTSRLAGPLLHSQGALCGVLAGMALHPPSVLGFLSFR
jgi:peptidoglycan/LPS O-acetylase OafA/YrhL